MKKTKLPVKRKFWKSFENVISIKQLFVYFVVCSLILFSVVILYRLLLNFRKTNQFHPQVQQVTNDLQVTETLSVTISPLVTSIQQIPQPTKLQQINSFFAYLDGVAYIDENNNGTRESYEKGLMGKDIFIYNIDNQVTLATKTIANNDGYYKVQITKPGRYQPQIGDLNMQYQYPPIVQVVFDTSGVTKRADLRLIPLGKNGPEPGSNQGVIQGITFQDTNKNGVQDGGESGIHFFKINIYSMPNYTIVATMTSDDQGHFTFNNVPMGTYRIQADNTSGQYTITKASSDVELSISHTIDGSASLGVVKNF